MTDTAYQYHYHEGDEERILACLQEHGEDGVSAFAMCHELGLKLQPLNAILERLQSNGQARLVRRKNGAITWYPDDKPPAVPIPPVADDSPSEPEQGEAELPERVPCPIDGCRSMIRRKQKPAYAHLYNHHGLRGDELHARLDDVLGADRQRGKPVSKDGHRSCPFAGCPSEFRGRHARASLINHLTMRHDLDREFARGIADGKLSPPPRATPTAFEADQVDADIVPPSEVECEGCDHLHGGECEQGEECVANCGTKMEQLQNKGRSEPESQDPVPSAAEELPERDGDTCRIGPLPPAEEFISDVKGAVDKCGGSLPWWDSYPGPRVLRFPDRAEYEEYLTRPPLPWGDLTVEQAHLDTFERKVREDLPLPRPAPGPAEPLNTCTPIEVQHVTISATERPADDPTPLARICSLAVEMEALAALYGASVSVTITTERRRPEIQLLVRGPAEASE